MWLPGEGQYHHSPSWPSHTKSTVSVWRLTPSIAPKLQKIGGHAKEKFRNLQIQCVNYAHEHEIDNPDVAGWTWPY